MTAPAAVTWYLRIRDDAPAGAARIGPGFTETQIYQRDTKTWEDKPNSFESVSQEPMWEQSTEADVNAWIASL